MPSKLDKKNLLKTILVPSILAGCLSGLIMHTLAAGWLSAFIRDHYLRNAYVVTFSISSFLIIMIIAARDFSSRLRYITASILGLLFGALSINVAAIIQAGGVLDFYRINSALGLSEAILTNALISPILGGWVLAIFLSFLYGIWNKRLKAINSTQG